MENYIAHLRISRFKVDNSLLATIFSETKFYGIEKFIFTTPTCTCNLTAENCCESDAYLKSPPDAPILILAREYRVESYASIVDQYSGINLTSF